MKKISIIILASVAIVVIGFGLGVAMAMTPGACGDYRSSASGVGLSGGICLILGAIIAETGKGIGKFFGYVFVVVGAGLMIAPLVQKVIC